MEYKTIEDLIGLTMSDVVGSAGDTEMIFTANNGKKFKFYHEQDCCEHVSIDDIIGDLTDLIGSPILIAEEISSTDDHLGLDNDDSYTWTFYRFSTVKGTVTVRWYGSSNGYYSESVEFTELT